MHLNSFYLDIICRKHSCLALGISPSVPTLSLLFYYNGLSLLDRQLIAALGIEIVQNLATTMSDTIKYRDFIKIDLPHTLSAYRFYRERQWRMVLLGHYDLGYLVCHG